MLKITKLVTAEELLVLCRDTQYTKIDIYPCRNKKTHDIRVNCYLHINNDQIKAVRGSLLKESKNNILPNIIKERLGGYLANFVNNNWITLSDFKRLVKLKNEYNLQLSIPKYYIKYAGDINE